MNGIRTNLDDLQSIVCAFNCVPWDQGLDLAFDPLSRAGPVKLSPLTLQQIIKRKMQSFNSCVTTLVRKCVGVANISLYFPNLILHVGLSQSRARAAVPRRCCWSWIILYF